LLRELLINASARFNIIITTGGTGIGPRDITVETVLPLLVKEIPGIMEYIRIRYGAEKPNALLSRGVAGIIGKSLIYTLPGSVTAVEEYLTEIFKILKHTVYMQYGIDTHHKH
jgi:molybdopterin adenylyltransferase